MNLAARDVTRHLGRFVGTAAGLGLLFAVVLSMQGIYAGMVDDATILTRAIDADLWIVQRDTRGPFAEPSRIDPSLEARAAAVPGVTRARSYTYQVVQREVDGRMLRLALVGLAWPDDRGGTLPLVAGCELAQAHGEIIVDASLGLEIGRVIMLADEPYRVVGLTQNALTSAGDAVAFMSVADSQIVVGETPSEALRTERERRLGRLRVTDLGRSQPNLEVLAVDPRWRPPGLPAAAVSAVLIDLASPHHLDEARRVIEGWGDVAVFTTAEQSDILLRSVVQRARLQLGLFSIILTVTASVIVMMVVYNMMREKTHDLAMLKLMGAPTGRILGLVFNQAWLLGLIGYVIALLMAEIVFPNFPRRVVITPEIELFGPIVVFALTTLASALGAFYALRVDPSRVLEG